MKRYLIFSFIILAALILSIRTAVIDESKKQSSPDISSFEECVAAGNPVAESYPEQCFADGQSFTNPKQKVQNPL